MKAEVEAVNLVNGERAGTLTGEQLDESPCAAATSSTPSA